MFNDFIGKKEIYSEYNYTMVNKDIANDRRLHGTDIGLMFYICYLQQQAARNGCLGLAEITLDQIVKKFNKEEKEDVKEEIMQSLRRLIKYGYLEIK